MKTREQIMQLIEDEDVEFIRLQFTDMFGNLKNIAITPGQLEKIQDCKYPFESSAVFDDLYDPDNPLTAATKEAKHYIHKKETKKYEENQKLDS